MIEFNILEENTDIPNFRCAKNIKLKLMKENNSL